MKKASLLLTLAYLPALAMTNDQEFNLSSFLHENKWHDRKATLTPDQREELGEYLESRQSEFSNPITDQDLGLILTAGLNEVEKTKSPEDLQDELYKAVLNNQPKKIRRTIKAGANPNEIIKGKKPIAWALALKKHAAIEALVENATSVDADIVIDAFYRNDVKAALVLVKNCNRTSLEQNKNRISRMALQNHVNTDEGLAIGQLLLDAGHYTVNDFWELYYSNRSSTIQLTPFMLHNKADVNYRINSGGVIWTPLLTAIGSKDISTITQLLDAGADINLKGHSYGKPQTPLAFTLDTVKDADIAEYLIKRGAAL